MNCLFELLVREIALKTDWYVATIDLHSVCAAIKNIYNWLGNMIQRILAGVKTMSQHKQNDFKDLLSHQNMVLVL